MKKKYGQTLKSLFNIIAILSALLVAIGIGALFFNVLFGIALIIIGLSFFSYYLYFNINRKKRIAEFLENIPGNVTRIRSNVMESFPMPMAIVHMDGTLKWYNESFEAMFPDNNLFTAPLEKIIPQIKWVELLKRASEINMNVEINEKKYHIVGQMMSERDINASSDEDVLSIYMYFIDFTNEYVLSEMHEQKKRRRFFLQ